MVFFKRQKSANCKVFLFYTFHVRFTKRHYLRFRSRSDRFLRTKIVDQLGKRCWPRLIAITQCWYLRCSFLTSRKKIDKMGDFHDGRIDWLADPHTVMGLPSR